MVDSLLYLESTKVNVNLIQKYPHRSIQNNVIPNIRAQQTSQVDTRNYPSHLLYISSKIKAIHAGYCSFTLSGPLSTHHYTAVCPIRRYSMNCINLFFCLLASSLSFTNGNRWQLMEESWVVRPGCLYTLCTWILKVYSFSQGISL